MFSSLRADTLFDIEKLYKYFTSNIFKNNIFCTVIEYFISMINKVIKNTKHGIKHNFFIYFWGMYFNN